MFETNRIYIGDCIAVMRDWPDGIVQTVVTSPPYWGLRDYGVPGQLGLEETPDQYVSAIVEVFQMVRRLLKEDGTVWVNLGDTYTTGGRSTHGTREGYKQETNVGSMKMQFSRPELPNGLKAKDLVGIPWRVAFALQSDGWYLRSDIIWSKPNPMPESVRDRPTKAHEYLFLLAKSERYYYDNDAIKEPALYPEGPNAPDAIKSPYGQGFSRKPSGWNDGPTREDKVGRYRSKPFGQNPNRRDSQRIYKPLPEGQTNIREHRDKQRGHSRRHAGFNERWDQMEKAEQCSGMRNKRSVWSIATMPFSEAHFATFPPALVKPCILAGSRFGDIVLDPFMGDGTVALVAAEYGRKFLGCELNPDYAAMAEKRIARERAQIKIAI